MPFLFSLSSPSRLAPPRRLRKAAHNLLLLCAAGTGIASVAGCGFNDYTVRPSSGLPASPTAAPTSNTYTGTQNPLNWTLTVDDVQNAFGYQSMPTDGSKANIASGTFVPQSGFLNLGASGLALEIPGAGALLRPGDNTTPPVVMVQQEGCLALTGKQRYLLQGLVSTAASLNPVIYRRGDVVADTTPDAKTWTFEDAEYFDGGGNKISLNYQGQFSAGSFAGTCSTTTGAPLVSIDTSGAYHVPTTFRFDSAGMAVADYSTSTGPMVNATASAIGFAQPVLPISAKKLTAASFRGFQVEYTATTITQPVSFGPALDGSAALNGGLYPNDDVTQTADTSALFQFGSQDSVVNGLFANSFITVLDPKGGCATHGVGEADLGLTPDGIATCRLHLSTTIGQLNGKAFLVASGYDLTVLGSASPDIQFYLIQQ